MSAVPSPANGASTPSPIPQIGMSCWKQLQPAIPVSRETWRKLVIGGKAPRAVRLSSRCTMYSNAEVHRWLADPVGYRQTEGGAV